MGGPRLTLACAAAAAPPCSTRDPPTRSHLSPTVSARTLCQSHPLCNSHPVTANLYRSARRPQLGFSHGGRKHVVERWASLRLHGQPHTRACARADRRWCVVSRRGAVRHLAGRHTRWGSGHPGNSRPPCLPLSWQGSTLGSTLAPPGQAAVASLSSHESHTLLTTNLTRPRHS